MIETPQIVHIVAQTTAVIRFTIPRADIQKVMAPGIGELMEALAAQGVGPAGPLFSHHLKMDPDIFDFEIGVPVASPIAAAGRVQPGSLPETRAARMLYHGPYEGLGPAWAEFGDWIAAQGYAPGPDLWECYMAGPQSSPDPTAWRTQLNRPLLP